MNNNNNKTKIIFGTLMLVALVAGLWLVRNNQNTERGAYFSGTKLLIVPENITATVGSQALSQLFVDTENGAKLSSLDTVICYGSNLSLSTSTLDTQVVLNSGVLKDLVDASLVTVDGKSCLRLVAIAGVSVKPDDLKSGLVKVADIKFNAVSVGNGRIDILANKSKAGGYNPTAGATDNSLQVTTVTGANYIIEAAGGTGDTPTVAPTNAPTTVPTVRPTNAPTTVPTVRPTNAPTTVPTNRPTNVPTNGQTSGTNSQLRFLMSFYGVRGDAMCADPDKLPLAITVRAADGTSKTYNNIVSTRNNTSGDLAIYEVNMTLEGFAYKDNLAVFIKSPKSLQVKYGVNNQSSYYGVAGGEISGLTADANTTPTFDFSKYPLLMGEVTGLSSTQDGVIDGLDFSYIKTESIKRTEVAEHGYMNADMNGNCKMESQDVANMMLSLGVKQGQLY